jgi:hypothetical protein
MHVLLSILDSRSGPVVVALEIASVLTFAAVCAIAVRLRHRRPDYRAIHRMERDSGLTGYTAPVDRRRGKR